jgi:DNA-binding transcriptional ArsR family regulator
MTRVAVAKHLRLLEAAGLVVSRRNGREKLHYLNSVPIRLVHDRWVNKYTEGENLEADPPRRLVQSYQAVRDDGIAAKAPAA